MGYAATTRVILYWNLDQTFVIHRGHHVCFGEYNYCIYIDEKHAPGSLLIQKHHESLLRNSDLLNLVPCELDITSTQF